MTTPEPDYVEVQLDLRGDGEAYQSLKRAIETGEIRLRTDDDE